MSNFSCRNDHCMCLRRLALHLKADSLDFMNRYGGGEFPLSSLKFSFDSLLQGEVERAGCEKESCVILGAKHLLALSHRAVVTMEAILTWPRHYSNLKAHFLSANPRAENIPRRKFGRSSGAVSQGTPEISFEVPEHRIQQPSPCSRAPAWKPRLEPSADT